VHPLEPELQHAVPRHLGHREAVSTDFQLVTLLGKASKKRDDVTSDRVVGTDFVKIEHLSASPRAIVDESSARGEVIWILRERIVGNTSPN
jgi:hypothetical protein